MLRRVNPAILLGLIVILVLSLAISAGAQMLDAPTDIMPTEAAPADVAPVDLVPAGVASEEEILPAGAQLLQTGTPVGGGSGSAALGLGEAQLGKPFALGTDGPDTFSCSGLMRFILRETGVDPDAPFVPEGYLGRYPAADLANLQPGDIVIYPNWATMYAGNGMLLNANELEGFVTHTPMDYAGVPLGAVRPY